MIIDRDVEPKDVRIMFEYCGRKRDGSNAPPQRWIRPWTGNPAAGKGALMNAAQKFLQDKYPKDRCRVLRAALLPPTNTPA